MAMIQSITDRERTWRVITSLELLGCLTVEELFNGSTFMRCALSPEAMCPIRERTLPRARKRIEHMHGHMSEVGLLYLYTERGVRPHRTLMAHSKYTHETDYFFTY